MDLQITLNKTDKSHFERIQIVVCETFKPYDVPVLNYEFPNARKRKG